MNNVNYEAYEVKEGLIQAIQVKTPKGNVVLRLESPVPVSKLSSLARDVAQLIALRQKYRAVTTQTTTEQKKAPTKRPPQRKRVSTKALQELRKKRMERALQGRRPWNSNTLAKHSESTIRSARKGWTDDEWNVVLHALPKMGSVTFTDLHIKVRKVSKISEATLRLLLTEMEHQGAVVVKKVHPRLVEVSRR